METGSGTAQSGAARADHERPRVKVRHCPGAGAPTSMAGRGGRRAGRASPGRGSPPPGTPAREASEREFRRVVKGVDVTDIAHAELGERTLERLGGPHVAGAGGRGEYQDARPTSITGRAWARTDPIPNHIPGLARA